MMDTVDLPDPPRHVVDTSGWLEYFADGRNADFFADPIREVRLAVVRDTFRFPDVEQPMTL